MTTRSWGLWLCRLGRHYDVEALGSISVFHSECLRCGRRNTHDLSCFSVNDDGRLRWLSCHGTSKKRRA